MIQQFINHILPENEEDSTIQTNQNLQIHKKERKRSSFYEEETPIKLESGTSKSQSFFTFFKTKRKSTDISDDISETQLNKEKTQQMNSSNSKDKGLTIDNYVFNFATNYRENEKNFINNKHICYLNQHHVSQELSIHFNRFKEKIIFKDNSLAILPKLSVQIPNSRDYIITIDTSKMLILLMNNSTHEIIYERASKILYFAININISFNSLFFVVDFQFGLVQTFRIFFNTDSEPFFIQKISSFSPPFSSNSTISSKHLLCASFYSSNNDSYQYNKEKTIIDSSNETKLKQNRKQTETIFIWNIMNGHLHREIDMKEQIVSSQFIESSNQISILTRTSIYLFTINSQLIVKYKLPYETSFLNVMQEPLSSIQIFLLIGFKNGRISCLSFNPINNTIEIKQLPSLHQNEIENIIYHPSNSCFIASDVSQKVSLTTAVDLPSIKLDNELYLNCPICGSNASNYCKKCNRMFCSHCCKKDNFCIFCNAVSTYL